MAKKSVFWGMLALALTVSFAVVGCSDPLQEGGKVKIDYSKVSAVDKVTATKTTGVVSGSKKGVILTWDAVDQDFPVGYEVYAQQDGKNTIQKLTSVTAATAGSYKTDDGTWDPVTDAAKVDVDAWTALVELSDSTLVDGKSYRFGVRTTTSVSPLAYSSDIVWAEGDAIKVE
jgi:hypothetical protein